MVLAPVLWSTAGVLTRHVDKAGAFEQVFWRSSFAFAFVLAVLLLQKKNPLDEIRKAGSPGLLSGALWAVMFTTFVIALSLTSTANTLIVMSINPLLTALLAWAFLKEPVPLRTWLAAGASAVGIAWMAASDFGAHGTRDVAGMLVALTVPLAAATNLITLRMASARTGRAAIDLVPAVMLGGLISCLVALPLALPLQATPRDIALLSFLGFFQLGLPCILMVIASRSLLAPEMALLALLEVVLGSLWAWLFAGETPAAATLWGGGIVLSALIFNEIAGFRRIMGSKLSATRISG
jgi:drug/metabolite transporter (DMT)-like permease